MKCFAIKFNNGCYFITSSDDPRETFNEYMKRGLGPVCIESVIENSESYHEWALFREYLALYGIEKVRGATYTEWLLTDIQRQTLMEFKNSWSPIREKRDDDMDAIAGLLNKITVEDVSCLRCGGPGHNHRECYASHDINNEIIVDVENYSELED